MKFASGRVFLGVLVVVVMLPAICVSAGVAITDNCSTLQGTVSGSNPDPVTVDGSGNVTGSGFVAGSYVAGLGLCDALPGAAGTVTFANAGTFTYKVAATNSLGLGPKASATVFVKPAGAQVPFRRSVRAGAAQWPELQSLQLRDEQPVVGNRPDGIFELVGAVAAADCRDCCSDHNAVLRHARAALRNGTFVRCLC